MTRPLIAGPSGTAAWVARQAGTDGRSLPILALPDAARPEVYYALPQVPQVGRDSADRPVLTVSAVLGRRPGPADDSIFDLVESGSFACDLTLALPDDVVGATLLPLYARQAWFSLYETVAEPSPQPSAPLAEITGAGAATRVGLSAQLDRTATQAVLIALNGGESGLSVGCRVAYRTAESRLVVHLFARLASVYDYLHAHVDDSGAITSGALLDHLVELLRTGELKAWGVGPNGLESDLSATNAPTLLRAFLAVGGTLLDSLTPDLNHTDPASRFRLRTRPADATVIDVRLGVATPTEAYKDLDAPLEAVIGDVLKGWNPDDFIHLSYVDPGGAGGQRSVPRLVRGQPPARDVPDGRSGAGRLASIGGDLTAMTRVLQPDPSLRPTAHAVLASGLVHPNAALSHAFVVDDVWAGRVDNGVVDPRPIRVPLVDNPDAALWSESGAVGQFWYPPEFTLVSPDPAADPDGSPFVFTFRETGHDAAGRVVLEGEVLFTLRRGMGAATQAALQARGSPAALPVPTLGLSVALTLPLRDTGGQPRQVDLPGAVTDNGDTVTVRVGLLNEYLRAAYGDLAVADFQATPAALNVAYTFLAAVWVDDLELRLEYVDKIARTPVAGSPVEAAALDGRAYLDAKQVAYRSPVADLTFRREQPVAADRLGPANGPPMGHATAIAALAVHPETATTILANRKLQPAPQVVMIRPDIATDGRLQDMLDRRRIVRRSFGRTASVNVFLPCNTFGAFYRQQLGDRVTSIGCQDSFSLGQMAFKLYEPVDDPALASPLYRVYRSLSQPGRFLIVPITYRITRYAPSEGDRAYHPAIYMYSSLDPANGTNDRCVVMASLQPDVPPWARKELAVKLAQLHHHPVQEYVTEVESDLTYTWSLPENAAIQQQATKLWDSFQVALSTDLAGGLQLQGMLTHGGISAQVSFKLPDATTVTSSLILDLADLTGPWDGGPVETTLQGTRATILNRIERGVNVSDLAGYAADGSTATTPVDRLLTAGGSVAVDLPITATEAYPVYALQPSGPAELSEVTSYIENVHTNVVFVNLVNYGNHQLKRLDLRARLKEAQGGETPVAISEDQPVAEAAFVLPLTTYLGPRTLQFQASKTDTADHVVTTGWLDWDLAVHGNVISLTWDLIQ